MTMIKRIEIRINKETEKKIKELIKTKKGLYPNKSQLIRSAIWYLYNKEVKKNG